MARAQAQKTGTQMPAAGQRQEAQMVQQAAAVKQAHADEGQAVPPEPRHGAPAGADKGQVVALHGGEVPRPDPAGPDIDLFDNVPV